MEITRVGNPGEMVRANKEFSQRNVEQPVKHPAASIETGIPVATTDLEQAVKKMNDVFEALSTHLKFNFHEGTGEYYVSIVNEFTDEVVREVPPRKFLDMVAYMEKQMKGIFIDEIK